MQSNRKLNYPIILVAIDFLFSSLPTLCSTKYKTQRIESNFNMDKEVAMEIHN